MYSYPTGRQTGGRQTEEVAGGGPAEEVAGGRHSEEVAGGRQTEEVAGGGPAEGHLELHQRLDLEVALFSLKYSF